MTVKLPITEMNRFHDEWTLRYAFRTNVILYKATLLKKTAYGMFWSMAAGLSCLTWSLFGHALVLSWS